MIKSNQVIFKAIELLLRSCQYQASAACEAVRLRLPHFGTRFPLLRDVRSGEETASLDLQRKNCNRLYQSTYRTQNPKFTPNPVSSWKKYLS
jgi:hypothetical protein